MVAGVLAASFGAPVIMELRAQVPVTYATPDGGVVSADLYGSGVNGVVLAPGGRFDKSSWEPEARVLADAGFLVLAIDFRGRGASGAGTAGADSLHLDVLGAVQYLRRLGATSIAAVGASLGGWAVGEAMSAEPGKIDRAVFLAHSSVENPERLVGRKFFVVTRHDMRGGGVRRLDEIRDQYERAPEPKELLVLEGAAHAQALFQTDQRQRLLREIIRFLEAPCDRPAHSPVPRCCESTRGR
jgi:pimeloyl-ACP methyl ester carboxylesterase